MDAHATHEDLGAGRDASPNTNAVFMEKRQVPLPNPVVRDEADVLLLRLMLPPLLWDRGKDPEVGSNGHLDRFGHIVLPPLGHFHNELVQQRVLSGSPVGPM